MSKDDFITMVLPVRDRLFRLAQALLGDHQEAEDTLQDVMIKLWRKRGELDMRGNIEAYAMTVTRNACLDKLKSYRHRMVRHSPDMNEIVPSADYEQPDRELEASETMRIIGKLMQKLPEQQRLILHLRDVEQFAFEEIEQMTGISAGTIRVNLSRARKKMRELYISQKSYG